MLKVKSKNKEFRVDFNRNDNSGGTLNGDNFIWDIIKIKEGSFHIIKNNKSFIAEIIKADYKSKSFLIKVNGNNYELNVLDQYDSLLKEMGLDVTPVTEIKEVKAPMPGLVLEVAVEVGQSVKAGDVLLVLEAMKMENILKSPADGTVKKINVKKRDAVEKNAVLISFE